MLVVGSGVRICAQVGQATVNVVENALEGGPPCYSFLDIGELELFKASSPRPRVPLWCVAVRTVAQSSCFAFKVVETSICDFPVVRLRSNNSVSG